MTELSTIDENFPTAGITPTSTVNWSTYTS